VQKLLNGILDFHQRRLPEYRDRFRSLADAQHPEELFVACSDSRVVVDLFSESEPGDMFKLRNIGNMIPPASKDGHALAAGSAGAVVEYAVSVLGVKDIVILGHSECGAMKAIAGASHALQGVENLTTWLQHGADAIAHLAKEGPLDPTLAHYNQLSQANVLAQLANIETYECCARAIAEKKLRTHGFWFDVPTADVYAYDAVVHRFSKIDRAFAERLLADGVAG
jgi:carbonic anhydrase